MDTPGTLHQQVEEFGQETAELLCATLPRLPDPPVRILRYEDRFVISPPNSKPLPLYVSGEHLADMKVSIACQLDSVGHYLAVALSGSSPPADRRRQIRSCLVRVRSGGSLRLRGDEVWSPNEDNARVQYSPSRQGRGVTIGCAGMNESA